MDVDAAAAVGGDHGGLLGYTGDDGRGEVRGGGALGAAFHDGRDEVLDELGPADKVHGLNRVLGFGVVGHRGSEGGESVEPGACLVCCGPVPDEAAGEGWAQAGENKDDGHDG